MKTLQQNNIYLRKLREGLVTAVSAEDKNRFNEKIQAIIAESSQVQSTVKQRLEENFTSFIKDLDLNSNLLEQEKRIARNLHGSTVKHFQDLMLEFQSLESDLKSTNEGMILRTAEIALSRKLSKEEEMNIVQNPDQVQEMIQAKLGGQAHTKLQNAVRDLEDRHAEIKKLEQSIMQVHALIEELAGLVKLQGEMIDNICDNIASAKADSLKAEEDIFQSKQNMIRARRKKCIILIIVLVALVVILAPTLIAIL